jgi:hypothetical protein
MVIRACSFERLIKVRGFVASVEVFVNGVLGEMEQEQLLSQFWTD